MGLGGFVKNVATFSNPYTRTAKLYDKFTNPGESKVQAPTIDPRLEKLQKSREKEAKSFRKQLPQLEKEQQASASDAARRDLASKMSGIKEGANARGLLYSGLRQGAESAAAQESASNLAAQKAAINARLQGQAKALDEAALSGQIGIQGLQSQQADINLQDELARRQARTQGLAGLFGAGGQLGGAALGSR